MSALAAVEDAAVLQEISKLQAAIDRARSGPRQPSFASEKATGRAYAPPHRGRGTSWYRGGRSSTATAVGASATRVGLGPVSQHRKLAAPDPATAASQQSQQPASGADAEIVIDGVVFLKDPRRNKLVRKGDDTSAQPHESRRPAPSTPSKASVGGQTYVRTKNGNLIARSLVTKRATDEKVKRISAMVATNGRLNGARRRPTHVMNPRQLQKRDELCRFFTSTGQCRSGLTCPYKHDPEKLAICPRFLRKSCTLGDACPLSHHPDGHRMPHCVHFPDCKNGSSCRYPHVHVGVKAGICRSFAGLGYCEKGLACPERHVRECPEFSLRGTCATKGCRLPHIIRKAPVDRSQETQQVQYATDSDDGADTADGDHAESVLMKRKMPDLTFSNQTGPAAAVALPIKVKRRRLHDRVADQEDFLTFEADDGSSDRMRAVASDSDDADVDVDSDVDEVTFDSEDGSQSDGASVSPI